MTLCMIKTLQHGSYLSEINFLRQKYVPQGDMMHVTQIVCRSLSRSIFAAYCDLYNLTDFHYCVSVYVYKIQSVKPNDFLYMDNFTNVTFNRKLNHFSKVGNIFPLQATFEILGSQCSKIHVLALIVQFLGKWKM